jgi:hypothetical protein
MDMDNILFSAGRLEHNYPVSNLNRGNFKHGYNYIIRQTQENKSEMSSKTKKPKPYFSTEAPKTEKEETDDIYDSEQREQMLEDDEITPAEEGFMLGREEEPSKKETRKKSVGHVDSIADELAKEDAEDS